MSADFNTSITVAGTAEEIVAILKVIKEYEEEKPKQYQEEHNCGYIEYVRINKKMEFFGAGEKHLKNMSEEEIAAYIAALKGVLYVEAAGPYGAFGWLEEVDLFKDMADIAPTASFSGWMSGFDTGSDQTVKSELKDGLLHLYYKYRMNDFDYDNDDEDEDGEEKEDAMANAGDDEDGWDSESIYNPVTMQYIKEGRIYATFSEDFDLDGQEDCPVCGE